VTRFGVDFQALNSASSQVGMAAETFSLSRGQVEGMPRAPGATQEATGLLDRALTALGEALQKAGAELQEVSGHLSMTASKYESTERALATWTVPGMTGRGG
jgi:hypothetical protein